ncbi:MAG: ABC transporter ATP-binding protein [Nanoarchaeota archaeon]|nr:ABC transporter ATP-binding protein [Nanoarchaeota archaeon]
MGFKDNPIVFLFRYMWRFAKGNRNMVVTYLSLTLLSGFVRLVDPLVVVWLLNTIQVEGVSSANVGKLLGIISLFVVITLLTWLFHGPSRVLERKVAFIVRANYRKYLLDGMLALPQKWHTDHHSGDSIDKIEKGISALFNFTENSFNVVGGLFRLVSSYIVLIIFNVHATYIVFILFCVVLSIINAYDKRLRVQYKELNRAENITAQRVYDVISNITTVIILRLESLVAKELWKKIMFPFELYKKNSKMNEVKWFIVSLFVSIMTALTLGSYILGVVFSGSALLVGTLYALYGYTDRIGDVLFNFAWMYSDLVKQKTRIENAEELSNEFQKVEVVKERLPSSWRSIAIHNLTFSYQDKEHELHLKNVDFNFKRGERIALIGESGSGKTTFMKLIRALYIPKSAEVTVNGKPTSLKILSNDMTLIPQEPEIFATTMLENVTMGVPHALSVVERFAKMARFLHVVKRLPKQWHSSVVEKGVNLSGGEKQRLALTRGLLASADKSIVLMDEPTSSVDAHNEVSIHENIFSSFKGKTIISTIHRLHLLPMFDRVYVFDKGRIIAVGHYKELLKSSPLFKHLWKKYHRAKSA